MNKKNYLFFACVFSCMVARLMGMERYTQEQLIKARARWLQQEDRVTQLKYEAEHYAKDKPVNYINGTQCVADIDATSKTITTFIGTDSSVVLSYTDFDIFIQDLTLVGPAIIYHSQLFYGKKHVDIFDSKKPQ